MQKATIYVSVDLAALLEEWSTAADTKNTSDWVTFHIAHPAVAAGSGAAAAPAGRP